MKSAYFYLITFSVLYCSLGLQAQTKKLVILHTNDTHSRIESLPATDKYYAGWGGVVNRKALIDSIRSAEENVLLLDAGDFVQGTPYFNLFKGRVETGAMNLLKYDAGTLGNHEFDYGLDTLKNILKSLHNPVVCCNYDFSETPLKGMVKPYIILKKFGLKIGITGVGANPQGLILASNYEGMVFKPILASVNECADKLRNKEKCDLIICLSHIGYDSGKGEPNDITLAESSNNIDLIIGGHSHTYMPQPDIRKNRNGKDVLIFQTGKSGAYIGKIEVEMEKGK
ncbi:MAG: metallophosphoesterase [Prevotella sp.]|nr:metallophosphoesterase [Prevotella sp.]